MRDAPELTASATLTNTTLDDRDTNVTFSGDWTQQTGPNFFNQTSTYTQGAGNAFEFTFEGTCRRYERGSSPADVLTDRSQALPSTSTVTRSTTTAPTPSHSTRFPELRSTIDQGAEEATPRHARSCLV